MSDERDDLLRELGEGLAIEPSAGFAAQVRGSVAAASSTARAPWLPWLGALGLGAGVVSLTMLLTPMPTSAPQPPRPSEVARGAASPVVALDSREQSESRSAMASTRVERPGRLSADARRRSVSHATAEKLPTTGPDLTVLTNQPALLRQMWARVAAGGLAFVEGERAATSDTPEVAARISIAELTVAPIVVPDVVAGTGVPGASVGGAGVRRVISAESSARSRE